MNGIFSPESCRLQWKNVLHPAISRTEFTPEDDEKLRQLAAKYGGKHWPAIAEEMGVCHSVLLRRYCSRNDDAH